MIPKIIHYCWFGGQPMPPLLEKCLAGWRVLHPDFAIRRWDESNAPLEANDFVKGAFADEAWAFVSDYIRLWALEKEGGIYLDTDMLLLEPLTDFLDDRCFLGAETPDKISAGVIGAVPGHPFIKAAKEKYDALAYIPDFPVLIPELLTRLLRQQGFENCISVIRVGNVTVYPAAYFYPLPFRAPRPLAHYLRPESVAVHLWDTSWHTPWQDISAGRYRSGRRKLLRLWRRPGWLTPRNVLKTIYYAGGFYHLRRGLNKFYNQILRYLIRLPVLENVILDHASFDRKEAIAPPEPTGAGHGLERFTRSGIHFELDPAEHNAWRIKYQLFLPGTDRFLALLPPDAVAFDIGANLGYYALRMARQAPKGRVFAFEPFAPNFQLLSRQVALNDFDHIKVFPLAFGAAPQRVGLQQTDARNNGKVEIAPSPTHAEETIALQTFDVFIEQHGIERVTAIKVDIEGYEYEFLQGAARSIGRFRPILFIELFDDQLRRYGSSASEVVAWLEARNYQVRHADTGALVRSNYYLDGCFFDVICQQK